MSAYTYRDVITIAPSDAVNIVADAANNPRAYVWCFLQVLVTGNIVLVDNEGVARTITGAPVGAIFYIPTTRVNATGTTASVVGLIVGNSI